MFIQTAKTCTLQHINVHSSLRYQVLTAFVRLIRNPAKPSKCICEVTVSETCAHQLTELSTTRLPLNKVTEEKVFFFKFSSLITLKGLKCIPVHYGMITILLGNFDNRGRGLDKNKPIK